MNRGGGMMPTAELDGADTRSVALRLILNGEGTVKPYGVVYDNGMKLERRYDGRHLPVTQTQIERAMLRAGIDAYGDMCRRFMETELPGEAAAATPFENESLTTLNELCATIESLSQSERDKLGTIVQYTKPGSVAQIKRLAENLDQFDFVPGAASPEDYGRYMIMESGRFEYDDNLADYYDFEKYGRQRIAQEQGKFNTRGYVSYHGTLSMEELMYDSPEERPGFQTQENSGMQMG